jgi:sulfur carrier protein
MASIEISCNGEARKTASRTVFELLSELDLHGKRVAVELNRDIVARDTYSQVALREGDSIEIVSFVGGG